MGLGIALGGVAKGLESAENARTQTRELDLRQQALAATVDYRNKALSAKQQQIVENHRRTLSLEVDKVVAANLKVVGDVIKGAREAGNTPEQIAAAVEPLLADAETLYAKIGKDSSSFRSQANALIGIPQKPNGMTVGGTLESIKAKLATGQPLNEGEQTIYNDALRMSKLDRQILGLGIGDDIFGKPEATADPAAPSTPAIATPVPAATSAQPPAPAPTPAPAAATSPSAPMPPVPANLAGKPGLGWSPSKQRWFLPDGTSFNQQGVLIAPAVPTPRRQRRRQVLKKGEPT